MTTLDLLTHAAALHRAGRLDEAAAAYRRILQLQPGVADPWRLLGLIVRRQDPAAAVGLVRRAIALEPASFDGFGNLATVQNAWGRQDEAQRAALRAIRLNPVHPDAYGVLGSIHMARGAWDLAHAAYGAVLVCDPLHVEARLNRGLVALKQNDEGAGRWLRSALCLDPGAPPILYNLALALQLEGRLEEAERLYRRHLGLKPDHARSSAMLGRLRLLAGDLEGAEAALARATAAGEDGFEHREAIDRCARYRAIAGMAVPPPAVGGRPLAEEPTGLAVRGPFRDTSGYAWMVRRFVRSLVEGGTPVHLTDLRVEFVPAMGTGQRDPFFETLDRPVRTRSLLTFAIPSVAERVPGLLPVNFSMFEARTVPRSWLRYAASLPWIVVPTRSSFDAWTETGFPAERLRLCPLGVDPPPTRRDPIHFVDSRGRRLSDYPVRVLNVSDATDRKNLGALLRVWFRTSRADGGGALVLKTGKGQPEQDRKVLPFIEAAARAAGRRVDEAGPIFLAQGVLSDAAMTGLFASCTHYWSMSHGEGWDLPMTQAGAMGLRLMAPAHSAYLTYLDGDIATLIPSRVAPALPPYRGLEWWDPEEDAAAAVLAAALGGRDAPRASARDRLLDRFGWPQARARLLEVLREVGGL